MNTGKHKSKYHWAYVSLNIKIKVEGGNIDIVYTVVAYKLKVVHDEDDTLSFSLMKKKHQCISQGRKKLW